MTKKLKISTKTTFPIGGGFGAYKRKRMNMKKIRTYTMLLAAVMALALCLTGCGQTGTFTTATDGQSGSAQTGSQTASDPVESGIYRAQIEIQDYGTITLELDGNAAPKTVENFVNLAKDGFYDGLTFHRIMEGFMMQGGDPKGNGTGGSGQNIVGEFAANGVENPLSHTRGAISMARAQPYDSASSQFFIVHEDSTFLDGMYAAVGHVTEGMDVVDAVCTEAKPLDNNGTIAKSEQPVITSITILD